MSKLFISLLLFVATILVGTFYLTDQWNTFRSLQKENNDLLNTSRELDELIAKRQELVDEINRVSGSDLERITIALPQGSKAADLMVMLENLSVSTGLVLKRIDLASFVEGEKPAAPAAPPGAGQPRPAGFLAEAARPGSIKEFPIGLSVAGSYEAFKSFLGNLEKNLRFIDIQEVSFSSPAGEAGKAQLFEFQIKAKTYYQQ